MHNPGVVDRSVDNPVVAGAIVQTRTFAETAPLVGSGDRLAIASGAICALRAHDAIRIELT